MDTSRWERIETLFHEALDRPDGERREFLRAACADAPAILAEVEAMLAVHAGDARLRLERVLIEDESGRPGRRVGPWRLERLIGRGGMGEVWLAARADGAYEATAALKLVRRGWHAAQLVPRFRRERQLLARLRHPHIATLLDGGVTDDGHPYLAMEYVDGEPVTTWCGEHGCSLRQRLALFRTICDAVSFAHTNLVVHRDLKPANILVTADGRPILLDFGIAKLLDPGEGEPDVTHEEDRLLTPEHAAPEQLAGDPVTTATDVWGLGVLLYELLSGRRPFAPDGATPSRIREAVREEDPPPPSAVAAREDARALRGDLDRIVMKALRKEPERRYRSAEDFGDDVDRYLAGLPVRATPDSAAYRLGKLARRHRGALVTGAVVGALVVAFAVTSAWQARRTARERDAAVAARTDSDRAVAMLTDIFAMGNPSVTPGGDTLRVDQLLELAEDRIAESDDSPRVQAKLWQTLAEIHGMRSRLEPQRVALERALDAAARAGLDDEILALRHAVARLVQVTEGSEAAEPLFRESLAAHEARYGPDSPDVAIASQDLANAVLDDEESLALLERALAIRERGLAGGTAADSIAYASSLNALGTFRWRQGDMPRAADAFSRTAAVLEPVLPPDHPHLLAVRTNVAVCLQSTGRFAEAEAVHRQLAEARARILGEESAPYAASLANVGRCLVGAGRHAEAVDWLRRSLAITESVYGHDHEDTRGVASDLAMTLALAGRIDEAESVFARAVAGGSEENPDRFALARLRLDRCAGRPLAPDRIRALAEDLRRADPLPQAELSGALGLLGLVSLTDPDHAAPREAEAAFREALELLEGRRFAGDPSLAAARCGIETARAVAGEPFDREALAVDVAASEDWGLMDPALLAMAREVLAAER